MTDLAILTLAYILDIIIGDPRWLPHPVRTIGWEIEKVEKLLRVRTGHRLKAKMDKLGGVLLVIIIVGSNYGLFYFLNSLLLNTHLSRPVSYLFFIFFVYFASATLATNDLIKSGKAVINTLNTGNKEEARRKLSMIVGRDTNQLDNKGILKATIETLSENASDGIIAPMFYFAIGGLPLAMAYKAINTLDSMVGYKNEKYRDFGWAAARLDDIANYIPARITGVLIVTATFFLGFRVQGLGFSEKPATNPQSPTPNPLSSFAMMIRDGRKHSSPNSGIPEAAMAGALGVQLGGPSVYGGTIVEKPYIGEEKPGVQEQVYNNIYFDASENALSIVRLTSLLGFGLAMILLYIRTAQ